MRNSNQTFDVILLYSVLALLIIGFVMVASASVPIAEQSQLPLFHYAYKQLGYILVGLVLLWLVSFLPLRIIEKLDVVMLTISFTLLVIVLLPGIAKTINGSTRWLFVGPFSFQPSELVKLSIILYMASYLVRRKAQVKEKISGFIVPLAVIGVVALLLLLEPDFGTVVVLLSTALGMLFLGGVKFRYLFGLFPVVLCAMLAIGLSSSYRFERIIAFRDPWADQFNTGYQLVQSLIAFGQGGVWGMGLGNSIQKLLYLPESHSDFIFAVLAEELGLIGTLGVILLFGLFVYRAFCIAKAAQEKDNWFGAYMAYGIGLWIGLQAVINMGVNLGVLPTKGLTLPFMSAGGTSILVTCLAVGILFRVDYENRQKNQKI